jgi:acyl-CoA hydrolase
VLSLLAGQHVYFHGNHPIRYVYLCGIVLQFELAPGAGATKYALLMLDDGSGRAIEVKIPRRQKRDQEGGEVFPSNTFIDNLNVHASLGLASLFIDNKPVHVGTIIKVKGTIAFFRNRQIELKRVFLVKDTNEEVMYWASLAQFRRDVLAQPWVLTHAQMKAVDDDLEAQGRRDRERKKAKQAKLLRDRERKGKSDEKKERQRRRLQEVLDDGALADSNVIKAPWE